LKRRYVATAGAAAVVAIGFAPAASAQTQSTRAQHAAKSSTTTPIQHVVVIFQENVSFDHYFGTYPVAANTDGTTFVAKSGTPTVNGLSDALLTSNPNGANPQRLGHSQALTCDQDHDYTPEQQALDSGLVDKYIQFTNNESCSAPDQSVPNLVMDYYDGNTVTALWNYAQRFAMNDNSFGTTFGPSTPGALNLVSGQTWGATPATLAGNTDQGTVYGDPDPAFDDCSGSPTVFMSGTNIGDLLNKGNVTWGFFEGGFRPTNTVTPAVCGSTHTNIGGAVQKDYSPHHEPFQYYQSTSNPHHLPPSSVAEIGHTDQANHQYDLTDFFSALNAKNLPAVSFVKASRYQDGHAGYSDPLDEQTFLVNTLNALQRSESWKSTAVVIAWDDSDGWYDHVMPPIVNPSASAEDALQGSGVCGNGTPLGGFEVRCGWGPRLPLLVLSPYARQNFVDSTTTDQTSVLRFIEDNWSTGRIGGGSFDALAGSLSGMFDFAHHEDSKLILDPASGEAAH